MKPRKGRPKADLTLHAADEPASNAAPHRISRTESFARDFRGLPKEIQQRAERAIAQLVSNPSLRTKKMQGVKDIWEAGVTISYRMTFQRAGDTIILRRIGAHEILQREGR